MTHTIETLADEPRWELARVQALPGRSRGDLLGSWGSNVSKRFGSTALQRVLRRLPFPLDSLPPQLGARDWVPVYAQLLVTEAIVDECLGGELRALYPLLVEDTRAGLGRVHALVVKTIGPARAFKLAPRTFRDVHERGSADVEVVGHTARMTFAGTPLFGHPTWRLLQLYATNMMLELAGRRGTTIGESGSADGFVAIARW
jgi:hypothetical protein